MVITNLQEKQNRKIWVPIRGGNRGGWSLFNWEDVRDKPYKQRQMYLGNSATLGVLDRGGKWRKRDWYLKTDKKYQSENLTAQQQQAIKRDYQRMQAALNMADKQDEQKLTEQQMRELMKKIKMKKQGLQMPSEVAPDAVGLGFDKLKVQIRSKPSAKIENPHRLQAFDELAYQKQFKQQQENSKQQKRQKKKKHKQHKSEKKRSDSSDSQHKKKKKKQKNHKREKEQKRLRSKQRDEKPHKERQHKHKRDRSRSQEKRRKRHPSSSQER